MKKTFWISLSVLIALFITTTSVKAVSAEDSHKELVTVVTTPMGMENYQNIEDNLLEAAKYNDIENPDQYAAKRFDSRLKNVMSLRKKAQKEYKSEKKFLNSQDKATLKDYTKKLRAYLNALHDYAVTYQTDNPVLTDPKTSQDVINETQNELNEYKNDLDTKKADWTNAYNAITNQ